MIAGVIIFSILGVLYIGNRKYKEHKRWTKEMEIRQNQLFTNRARILHNRFIMSTQNHNTIYKGINK